MKRSTTKGTKLNKLNQCQIQLPCNAHASYSKPKKLPLPSQILFVSDPKAHSEMDSETALSIQKAVDRTKCSQVLIDMIRTCNSAMTMLIAIHHAKFFHPSIVHTGIAYMKIATALNLGILQHNCHTTTECCIS